MLRAKDGPGTPALPLMQALLRYGAAHCERVILEGILDAGVYRPLFVLGRELFGDRICACYYDIPFEETLRRHQTKPNCAGFRRGGDVAVVEAARPVGRAGRDGF